MFMFAGMIEGIMEEALGSQARDAGGNQAFIILLRTTTGRLPTSAPRAPIGA